LICKTAEDIFIIVKGGACITVEKPSDREKEYFLKMDMEKTDKIRQDLDRSRAEEEQQRQKEAHWMKYPRKSYTQIPA